MIGGEETLRAIIESVESNLQMTTHMKKIFKRNQLILLKKYIFNFLLLNFGNESEYYGGRENLQNWLDHHRRKVPKLSKQYFEMFEDEFMDEIIGYNVRE